MSTSGEFRHEELLAEELTPEEVRLLVERLDARSFGGSENATVGAVVEATGANPVQVGRLLSEIRKESFEGRFGLQLKEHEHRIDSLENRARRLETSPRRTERPALDPYQQKALDRMAAAERHRQDALPLIIVILVLALGFIVFASSQGRSSTQGRVFHGIQGKNGWIEEQEDGSVTVRLSNGTTREATSEERAEVEIMHGFDKR